MEIKIEDIVALRDIEEDKVYCMDCVNKGLLDLSKITQEQVITEKEAEHDADTFFFCDECGEQII